MSITVTTCSTKETLELGLKLSSLLRPGDIVLLSGPLGAGKTAFIRGVVEGLDPKVADLVTSQSYVVAVEYPTLPKVIHLDLYRLTQSDEIVALGFEEMIYNDEQLTFVEWPELLEPLLEQDDPVLTLRLDRPDQSSIRTITANSIHQRLEESFRTASSASGLHHQK